MIAVRALHIPSIKAAEQQHRRSVVSSPRPLMTTSPSYPAAADDILSWTNQDCRESVLFNSWGVLYRFQVRVIAEISRPNLLILLVDDCRSEWGIRNNNVEIPQTQQRRPHRKAGVGNKWRSRTRYHGKG